MVPPFSTPTGISAVAWLEQIETARKRREDQMRNALEILAYTTIAEGITADRFARYIRRVAREGLGWQPLAP